MTPDSETASALDLTWFDRAEALDPLLGEWGTLADQVGAEIFLQPDWFSVWWSHFGKGRRLACLAARRDGVLVGLLPFSIERIWIGPWPVKVARLAGTDPNTIVFQLPLQPEVARPVLRAAIEHLTGPLGCLAVSFTPTSEMATYSADLKADTGPGSGFVLLEEKVGSHIVFPMPATPEAFLAGLSRNRREKHKKHVKALTASFEITSDGVVPDADAFDAFVTLHNAQWQAIGKGGHFCDWPGSAAFYRDLATRTAAARRVQVDRLLGNTGALAMELSLVSGRRAHWHLPARSLDPEAQRGGAGSVIFVRMFERMIREGITLVEGGRGEYSYKLSYGGQPIVLHRMIARRDRPMAKLGLGLVLGWADLLNLLYYRIWFLKLTPLLRKLPGNGLMGREPRPLWRSWIRSRL